MKQNLVLYNAHKTLVTNVRMGPTIPTVLQSNSSQFKKNYFFIAETTSLGFNN